MSHGHHKPHEHRHGTDGPDRPAARAPPSAAAAPRPKTCAPAAGGKTHALLRAVLRCSNAITTTSSMVASCAAAKRLSIDSQAL